MCYCSRRLTKALKQLSPAYNYIASITTYGQYIPVQFCAKTRVNFNNFSITIGCQKRQIPYRNHGIPLLITTIRQYTVFKFRFYAIPLTSVDCNRLTLYVLSDDLRLTFCRCLISRACWNSSASASYFTGLCSY